MAISAEDKNFLVSLYVGYFNRAPDPAGLQFWIDQVEAGRDTNTIAADFAASPEAKSLYPFLTTPDVSSPTSFITAVYANLFNRAPDAAGQAFWEAQLSSGAVSPADAIDAIIKGATTAPDSTILANKNAVGLDFATDAGNTPGFTFDLNGSSGSAAKSAISGVTEDASTVVAAQAATDAYLNGVAGAGETFTLTTGADDINGTADNDTITALSVNATGTAAETFSAFDDIDGGAGTDTLNIFADGKNNLNDGFPASGSVKNVEIVNINNIDAAGFGAVDASNFQGATQIWQAAFANNVSNLAATTTAGLRNVDGNVTVAPAAGAAAAAIALENFGEGNTLTVDGSAATSALAGVTVSGSVKDTNSDGTTAATALAVTAGKDVETLTVNTAAKTTLTVTENAASAASKDVRTIDASESTGGVTFAGTVAGGTAGSVATVKGGSGDDTLTIATATKKDDAATTADESVSALVEGGAGKDGITINTTGDGTTTVNAGEGDDMVTLTQDGTGKLSVDLGAGNDTFKGAGAVSASDMIDGGAGTDTLLLTMVGAANIGAFSNFETFDAVGLNKTLDTDILAAKNTVTEYVTSGAVGANALLTNVGSGVGVRVTGDMDANDLAVTQKTAGALKVTHDIDETGTKAATTAAADVLGTVTANNATSIETVFDSTFVGAATGAGDNVAQLDLIATKATSLTVNSGGNAVTNDLNVTGGDDAAAGKGDLLTSVTITGSQKLDFGYTAADATEITSVDASASTGGLVIDLDVIKDTGTVKLGSGDDSITAQAVAASDTAAIAEHVKLSGIEKGAAEDLTVATGVDTITFKGAVDEVQAADNAAGNADASVVNGKITFKGAGPATLAEAVEDVQGLIGANEVAVFEYVGNSYIFSEGADGDGGDTLVELTGVTGLNGVDEVGTTDAFYVF